MNRINVKNDKRKNSPHRELLIRIPEGRENAISMRDLARSFGEDDRCIRHRIEQARIDGNIIAGTNAGIFIPETVDELKEYVYRSQSRINTSTKALAPAIKLLGEMCNA